MPQQVFGAQATAVQLYIAFYGAAPSNPIFNNLMTTQGASSPQALALTIGNAFSTVSDAALAAQVLGNLGITAATTNQAAYDALLAGLTAAFAAFPTQRGLVVLNLTNILTTLETNATYGGAAQAFNNSVTNAYVYASNPANTTTVPVGGITITTPLTVNAGDVLNGSAGNDVFNGNLFFNAPGGNYIQTLQSGDSINGGAGNDTLNVGLNAGGTINPAALTSIETINATVTAATTLDMINATGLTTLSLTNGTQLLTLSNNGALITTLNLTAQTAGTGGDSGVNLGNTAASIAGTADALTVNLSQVTQTGTGTTTVTASGYETITFNSTGSVTNTITTLTDANVTKLVFTGSAGTSVAAGTGVTSTTLRTIDASAATGAVTVGAAASTLGVADQSVVGGSGNDTFFFGGNYTTGDTVTGGAGTDTIAVTNTVAAGVSAAQANVTTMEVVRITDAASGTFKPDVFGGATTLRLDAGSGGAITVNYLAGTSGLNLQTAAVTHAVTLNTAGTATNDALTLTLGTATAAGVTHTGAFTMNGTESLTIASNGTSANSVGAVTLTPTGAQEAVTVTGNAALNIGALTADSINASANTGGLNMTAVTVAAGGVNIVGSGANDTLMGSSTTNVNDLIDGGAGNDRIQGGGVDAVEQSDVLTGGTGADQFVFQGTNKANLLNVSSAGNTNNTITRITDFVAGTDKIVLLDGSAGDAVTLQTGITVASAADVTAILAAIGTQVAASGAAAHNGAVVTVSGGAAAGTYLFINDTANAADGADLLINITGITGTLTTSDFLTT